MTNVVDAPLDEEDNATRIVAIGASAGGLDALQRFFGGAGEASHLAFVVIQHLSPDYKSMMPELLARHTDLPIHVVQNDMRVQPGAIHLIPPKKNMTVVDDRLVLVDKPDGHDLNLPIDIFFTSLAEQEAERAVAVVLSGTGSDGSRGVRTIKEADGMVIVQDPEEAAFNGMPVSAVQTGLVDFILPAGQMVDELRMFLDHPPPVDADETPLPDDDETWDRVLGLVRSATGMDFSSYRRPTLWRRMLRRISIHRLPSLQAYMQLLERDAGEAETLSREFLIGVTKFFRDPASWDVIERQVLLPLLREKQRLNEPFKAWVAGCSTGEEAYTLAMLVREIVDRERLNVECKIFATDLMQDSLDVASRGVYPESLVADVPSKRVSQHFIRSGDRYEVVNSIRRMVIFSRHDLVKDPPFSRMDFVSCRNVLIYFDREQQHRVVGLLHYALNLHGTLFLGSSESAGQHETSFEDIDRRSKIFRCTRIAKRFVDSTGSVAEPRFMGTTRRAPAETAGRGAMGDSLSTALAEELGVIGVVVDETYQIVHALGELRRLTVMPEQGFTSNLLKLLPASTAAAVRTVVRGAIDRQERRSHRAVPIPVDGNIELFDLVARPFSQRDDDHAGYALLVLSAHQGSDGTEPAEPIVIDESGQRQITDLEIALARSREELNAAVEDLEASNEELQASNEELLAANEELQSTNEELQSVNEELHTVNVEFQQKTEELADLNSEMSHVLDSTDIATAFLDHGLRIRRMTVSCRDLFSARDDDLGRPLSDFTSAFGTSEVRQLLTEAATVLRTGESTECEVQTEDGTWYLRRVNPFIDGDGKLDGVVVSFVDIDATKQAQELAAQSQARLLQAQHIAKMGDFTWDVETGEVTWSDGLYDLFGVPVGTPVSFDQVHEEIHPDDDRDGIEAWLDDGLRRDDGILPPYRYRTERGDGAAIDVEAQGIVSRRPDGTQHVVGTVLDVTARVELEHINRRIMESSINGIFIRGLAGDGFLIANPRLADVWGHSADAILSWDDDQATDMIFPADRGRVREFIDRIRDAEDGRVESVECRGITDDGEIRWFSVMGSVFDRDAQGAATSMLGFSTDITEAHSSAATLLQRNEELAQFASLAAHDLQEPLRTLRTYSDVLVEELGDNLDEPVEKSLGFIASSATRMSHLIRDLLEYSSVGRSDEGEQVDMHTVVETVIGALATSIEETGAQVSVGDVPTVPGRRDEYELLVQNLLSNALKYRRADVTPVVSITSHQEDDGWRWTVTDNGIGIAPEHHDRIFGIFQRLHARSEFEGTGIGLAQCKKIVESIGGRIWCESELGAGTTFHFTTPTKLRAAGVVASS